MSRNHLYITLTALALVALAGFILFGPDQEKSEREKNPVVWNSSWEKIEFRPAGSGSGKSGGTPGIHPASGATGSGVVLAFLRKGGLLADRFYVESPRGGVAGAPAVERRAAGVVKNIFRDWSAPMLKGVYDRQGMDLEKRGFSKNGDEVLLYRNAGGSPVVVRFGEKTRSGDRFLMVQGMGDQDRSLFIVPSYLLDRFHASYDAFREKRIVEYPTASYIGELSLHFKKEKNSPTVLRLEQRPGEGDASHIYRWYSNGGREIPPNIASPFENRIRRIVIDRFRDDPAVTQWNVEDLWKKAGSDLLVLHLSLHHGDAYTITIRRPAEPLVVEGSALYLMQSSLNEGIDWTSASNIDDLLMRSGVVASYLASAPPVPAASGDKQNKK